MSQERRTPRRLDSYERWTDRQVREAIAQGRFDQLEGTGKPLPDIDEPHDELWWLRKKLREEQVSVLPPSLLLRREVEQLLTRALAAPSERQAEKLIEQANTKIRQANRLGMPGPPHNLSPYDPAALLERWRELRRSAAEAVASGQPESGPAAEAVASGQPESGPASTPSTPPTPSTARSPSRRRWWLRRR